MSDNTRPVRGAGTTRRTRGLRRTATGWSWSKPVTPSPVAGARPADRHVRAARRARRRRCRRHRSPRRPACHAPARSGYPAARDPVAARLPGTATRRPRPARRRPYGYPSARPRRALGAPGTATPATRLRRRLPRPARAVRSRPRNGMGIAAMVLGIIAVAGFCLYGLGVDPRRPGADLRHHRPGQGRPGRGDQPGHGARRHHPAARSASWSARSSWASSSGRPSPTTSPSTTTATTRTRTFASLVVGTRRR